MTTITMLSDEAVSKVLADNVIHLLEAKRWSQSRLAIECGESDARISALVLAKGNPQAPFVARVAVALGVTPNDLMLPRKFPRR